MFDVERWREFVMQAVVSGQWSADTEST